MALPPGPVGLKFWQPRVETTEANWFRLYDNSSLPSSTGTWGNNTLRQAIPVAGYSADAPATGTKLRVTVQSGTTFEGGWDKLYIGHAAASGDTYDFDGTQVQVFFSGSPSGSIAPGRATITSDAVIYAFDKTKPLVISMHNTGGINSKSYGSIFSGMPAGFDVSQSADGVDEAATTNATALSVTNNRLSAFPKVEVYSEPVADSGPITLPADGGSYTLTGSDTGLGLGYWLTGSDAAFVTASAGGTTLAADAGSYTLTGTAAALAYSATLTAGAGSYAITGSAVGLGLGYWLTGSDVTFTTAAGGGTTLTAAASSYTLTGSTAALALRHTAGAGNYSLTGTAAAYQITFAAAAGSYTLTGSDVAFVTSGNAILTADAGNYTLTGTAAALNLGIAAGSSSYTLTGSAAAQALGHVAAAGSYALTGTAAAYRVTLTAAVNSYTLTGFDAGLTVISGIVLFCGSGSYTLTGFDAALPQPGVPVEPPVVTPPGGAGDIVRRAVYKKYRLRKKLKRDECEELLAYLRSLPPAERQVEIEELADRPWITSLLEMMPVAAPALAPAKPVDDDDDECIALLIEILNS